MLNGANDHSARVQRNIPIVACRIERVVPHQVLQRPSPSNPGDDKLEDGKRYTCALDGFVIDEFVVDGELVTCTCAASCDSGPCETKAAVRIPCIVSDEVDKD